MNPPIRLLPEAKEEFDQATDWHERQEPGLGTRFVAQIRENLARIASDPETYAIVYRDVRKTLVRRFPFALIYR